MIFSGLEDDHDRLVNSIIYESDVSEQKISNFNLVGIRRRLNNIEIGVWFIVILQAISVWRHW